MTVLAEASLDATINWLLNQGHNYLMTGLGLVIIFLVIGGILAKHTVARMIGLALAVITGVVLIYTWQTLGQGAANDINNHSGSMPAAEYTVGVSG